MKYLTGFFTEQAARDYSKECRDMVQNFTMTVEYMYSWRKHSTRSEWALIIPDGWQKYLKPGDESKIIDQLDATWWGDPAQISDIDKYQIFWREFADELKAEFNARNKHLVGADALHVLTKLSPVIAALNGLTLGAARDILSTIQVDTLFPQSEKDYFLNKLNNYLAQWQ